MAGTYADGPQCTLVGRRLEQERVRHLLRRLTPGQRQVLVLRYLEGWSHEEIARALRKPVGAVKALQHRGVRALRRWMEREEAEEATRSSVVEEDAHG